MKHNLYKTEDNDRHPNICDSNGEVVLGCCRNCGRAEIELDQVPECDMPHDLYAKKYPYDFEARQREDN